MKLFLLISFLILIKTDEIDFEKFLSNPFRILEVAPWSSYKEIKSKYNKLVKMYHPDKSKNLETKKRLIEIQQAFQTIKKNFKNEETDDDFEDIEEDSVFHETGNIIIIIAIIFGCLYLTVSCAYVIFMYTWKYIFFLSIYLVIFEKLLPHLFSLQGSIIISNLLTILSINIKWLLSKFRKSKEVSPKEKQN
jgi:hypothetical protein